jgi:hypothetical protein
MEEDSNFDEKVVFPSKLEAEETRTCGSPLNSVTEHEDVELGRDVHECTFRCWRED